MKDSRLDWIGLIPDSWNIERIQWHLNEVKEINRPIKTSHILSLTNKLGVVPYEQKGNQGNVAKENLEGYKLAFPDTIVANSMNILIGSVGYCAFYGCVSPVYYVYKSNESSNICFFNYLLQTEQFQKELRKYAKGILEIRLRVSSDDILKSLVPVPPLNEQNRIVSCLNKKINHIEKLISNATKQIEKLEEYKKAVITKAVTKGLDSNAKMKDSGVKWIGVIPENWRVCRLKNVVTIENGKEIRKDGGDVPVYGSGGIFKYTDRPIFVGESLLMGRKGTIDKPMLVDGPFWTVDTMFYTSRIEGINAKFLFYACCGLINFDFYKSGSVLPSMTQTELNNIWITRPSEDEQQRIVDYLDGVCGTIQKIISLKKNKIDKLQQYKKSLIYEYVTGKKVVEA